VVKSTPQAENAGHILAVDDDSKIRDLLGRFLGKHGYRVIAVAHGGDITLSNRDAGGLRVELRLPR